MRYIENQFTLIQSLIQADKEEELNKGNYYHIERFCRITYPPRKKIINIKYLGKAIEPSYPHTKKIERETGFEPATSTLARLRSTN